MKNNILTWEQFEVCHPNTTESFEKLCRTLFINDFFEGEAFSHSNPNNPGIEIEPLMHIESNKRISFQSKYFSSIRDYGQIKHSAKMTVKYYSDKLDVFYLYSNKDLDKSSAAYKEIEEILSSANIEIILINNQAILDRVMKYPTIAKLYFSYHGITFEWFEEQLNISLRHLGMRYNKQFNVSTKSDQYIDLFSQNTIAIKYINGKKIEAINNIRNCYAYEHSTFIDRVCYFINSIEDINAVTILDCLNWFGKVRERFSEDIQNIESRIQYLEVKTNNEKIETEKKVQINYELNRLKKLISVLSFLNFSNKEVRLLKEKVLVVRGTAGMGKSQLFANAAVKNSKLAHQSLLLLGHTYLSNGDIQKQIMEHLELELTIDELLVILDGIGEQNQQQIVIFVDAVNESGYREIWKNGLNKIIYKIEKLSFIKLAISVRNGYEQLVFDEFIHESINNSDTLSFIHSGFKEEGIEALKTFLDYYNIPFSPNYLFVSDMENPLFLTLFCKTYSGENMNIFTVFEKVIENTEKEIRKIENLEMATDLLIDLIYNIIEFKLVTDTIAIRRDELLSLKFWDIYGLSSIKMKIISIIEKSGLFLTYIRQGIETYRLGYNLLEDYLTAKYIMRQNSSKYDLREYIKDQLLQIENGKVLKQYNLHIFLIVCSMYVEKYSEECIDIIDNVDDEFFKEHIIEEYIKSYLWRNSNTIESKFFREIINEYNIDVHVIWDVLIGNSIKLDNQLNADFLHEILLNMPLNYRDKLWTTYINDFTYHDQRVYQLIELFNKGEELSITLKEKELLLTLFAWSLTSTNRVLRDKASKAMIEILKKDFNMCYFLLERFTTVNDPYVIQRIYGIVLGATLKRTEKFRAEYTQLAQYVYNQIFNKEEDVYPDILLRDYARLILERYLYEYPSDNQTINRDRINPPYSSKSIPEIDMEERDTYDKDSFGNYFIFNSMRPDHKQLDGMYGDFGRYVLQASLSDFVDIDIANIYYYGIKLILNDLGYTEELFGGYDRNIINYDRHQNKKIERIGKKYQWIAMYNILARVSDKHKLKDWDRGIISYEGPWNPYVRDFDPTLNCNFLVNPNIPCINIENNESIFAFPDLTDQSIQEWIRVKGDNYENFKEKLIFEDDNGEEWVALNYFEKIQNKQYQQSKGKRGFEKGAQEIWGMAQGYFVKGENFISLKKDLEKKNFIGRVFPESSSNYQLFNREYVWSPGCKDIFKDYWKEYRVEKNTVETIYEILPAYSRVLWEEEYDASQDETIAFDIPCTNIIEYLQLEQKKYDGYFYSVDNILVAFDGNLSKNYNGLIIKKEYLLKFIKDNNFICFWTVMGEKTFYKNESGVCGEFSGFYYLENEDIEGTIDFKKVFNLRND